MSLRTHHADRQSGHAAAAYRAAHGSGAGGGKSERTSTGSPRSCAAVIARRISTPSFSLLCCPTLEPWWLGGWFTGAQGLSITGTSVLSPAPRRHRVG